MPEGSMRLALTGDSLIARRIAVYQDAATQRLFDILRGADVSFTNLESLPNDFYGYPVEESGGAHLAAHEWVIDELLDAGITLMATPNNHSLNYEIEGLLRLIEILQRRGIAYAGIGRNLAEAREPHYLDTAAGSVALLACASTFAKGQQASEQRPNLPGRPGLNPLRYTTTHTVRPEQLAALRSIANDLGMEQRRLEGIQLGFRFAPDDPLVFPFLDHAFVEGETPAIRTAPHAKDLSAICGWVEEAAGRADLVVVSVHAHEQGAHKEEPAEFLRTFAHAVIDAGAHIVTGHGPHLLRGMELYRRRPIFYSLGNFVGQNELTWKLPSDSYETFRTDGSLHPGQLFRQRTQNDEKGFPSDARYWESMAPVTHWEDGELQRIDLHPISLGLGMVSHRRGRPRYAQGAAGEAILQRFAALSAPFGTTVVIDGDVGSVPLM